MSEIGSLVNGRHVEQAVLDTLEDFLPTYLGDRAVDMGLARDTFRVRSYARAATLNTRFPEEGLPCVVVRCTGKASRGREGRGHVSASFPVSVGVVVADVTRQGSSDIAWEYATAIEAVLIQQGSLGGFASATDWNDTAPDDLELEQRRTLAGAVVEATVIVENVIDASAGPLEPPDEPYEPLPTDPTVLTVDVTVDHADDE